MTRLELLKKELEIARNLKCLSFEGKQIAIEWYENEIECIEKYGSPNPEYEVKKGEWKHNKNNDVIKCSECGFGIMDSTFVWEIRNCCGTIEDNPFNFCSNCGADMRGKDESTDE